jgi:pimeloyl-ACP methyl ester carboxylesterase
MNETSPATDKPTIVLVHGAYHRPEHWGLLQLALDELGYKSLAVDLPVEDPDLTQDDDARTVADATKGMDNIMVVAHSRAGDFLAQALERTEASRRVGVFLCASGFGVELPPDMPPRNTTDFEQGIRPGPNGLTTYDRYRARRYFYPYHHTDEMAPVYRAARAIALLLLRPQRGRTKPPAPLPSALPEDLKFFSIHGSRDSIVNPRWSEKAEETLGLESVVIPDGHSPYIANPRRLARILADIAVRSQLDEAQAAPIPRQRIPADQSQPPVLSTFTPARPSPGRHTNEELKVIYPKPRQTNRGSA